MMYRYLNATHTVAAKVDDDGVSRSSCSAENEEFKTWIALGNSPEPYVAPALSVPALLAQIDADTDSIYGSVLGNRAEEYTLAANEAQAFKTAGYTGAVPSSVQSWAAAKSWTTTQAADDILLTAARWIGAQSAIRAERLLRKEQIRTAVGDPARAAVMVAWAGFVSYMRGQLGL